MKIIKAINLFGLFISLSVFSQQRPPLMGWASWNNYRVNISESIIKAQADAIVSSGLSAVGYKFINIDDGYFDGRNANGSLKINTTKFPNGMKPVADYIHSKGLKAGFYSEGGANTCGTIYDGQTGGVGAGLYNHDQQDIDSIFKAWGYDFLKVDFCGGMALKLDEKTRYKAIKTAIDNTGRTDISFNVCRWQFPGKWVTTLADSWRISGDISPNWTSVTGIIDNNTYLAAYSSRGHYNDMDMLEVGRGMTFEEDRSHFSMWCILSSPLILGNDLTTLSAQSKLILSNTEVIAVNQDTTGVQAQLISDDGAGLQVWAKQLNGKQSNERAVVFFNRSATVGILSVKWKDLNLAGPATVRDLWSHTDLGSMDSMYTVKVATHGVVMLKVVGTKAKLKEVFEGEYSWINNYSHIQNNTVIANQGISAADGSCSGKAKASWLGNNADNYIEFRDVYANYAGKYNLTVSYLTANNRNATISVNGKDTLLQNLNSGGWNTVANITFPVILTKGTNIIRISNATDWLPDIDKIKLDLNRYEPVNKISQTKSLPLKIYPNPCKNYLTIDTELALNDIKLYSLSGCLVKQYYQKEISLGNVQQGLYLLKINTAQGTEFQKIIKE